MHSSPSRTLGNCGGAGRSARFTKSEGIRTLVRKLRLCQSARGRSRTRVDRLAMAPSSDWRTMFLRLFFGKRIGTTFKRYETVKKLKGLKSYQIQRPATSRPFNVFTL